MEKVQTFRIFSKKLEKDNFVSYLDNTLISLTISPDFNSHLRKYFMDQLPVTIADGEDLHKLLIKRYDTCTVTLVMYVASFEEFWEAYRYKHDKLDAEAAYEKLSVTDKIAAIEGIEKYDRWLKHTGIAKKYAVRYLKKKEWLNEHRIVLKQSYTQEYKADKT